MMPAASVSGLYFAHPEAKYFNVGRLGRDQVEDYAAPEGDVASNRPSDGSGQTSATRTADGRRCQARRARGRPCGRFALLREGILTDYLCSERGVAMRLFLGPVSPPL